MSWLKRNWFSGGVVMAALLAFALPGPSALILRTHVLNIAIFLLFFTTGLQLEVHSMWGQARNLKVLGVALAVSLALIPVLAYGLARMLLPWEFAVGVCLIAAAPVTLASGTILTEIGRGNVPASLVLSVAGNVAGIFTLPVVLKFLLAYGGHIDLPVLRLLAGLTLNVLLPTLLGLLARRRLQGRQEAFRSVISIFQQLVILLFIYNAMAVSSGRILALGWQIAGVAAFIVGLHVLILAMDYWIARLVGFDRPTVTAFTLHVSQKTLGVTTLLWAGFFAGPYPLSLIPGVLYHITQMVMDSFLAQWFQRRAETA